MSAQTGVNAVNAGDAQTVSVVIKSATSRVASVQHQQHVVKRIQKAPSVNRSAAAPVNRDRRVNRASRDRREMVKSNNRDAKVSHHVSRALNALSRRLRTRVTRQSPRANRHLVLKAKRARVVKAGVAAVGAAVAVGIGPNGTSRQQMLMARSQLLPQATMVLIK